MTAALREVKTFKLMNIENLPDTALQLSNRDDELFVSATSTQFFFFHFNLFPFALQLVKQQLSRVVEWYNAVVENTEKCEFDILEEEMAGIDIILTPALDTMTWESYSILSLKKIHTH